MKIAVGVWVALLLITASPVIAGIHHDGAGQHAQTVLAQASPSPSPGAGSPTASPSPGEQGDRGGISTGAGLVIAAVLVGGLLLMRNRLLRR
jgi:hypothetical protein